MKTETVPSKPIAMDRHCSATLNEANIESVAERIRLMLTDKPFAIVELQYYDQPSPRLSLQTDCWLRQETKDGKLLPLVAISKNNDGRSTFLKFSAGDYLWMFDPAPGDMDQHEEFKWPYFYFEHDWFSVRQFSPDRRNLLRNTFKVQEYGVKLYDPKEWR